jgi:hypothetical protein
MCPVTEQRAAKPSQPEITQFGLLLKFTTNECAGDQSRPTTDRSCHRSDGWQARTIDSSVGLGPRNALVYTKPRRLPSSRQLVPNRVTSELPVIREKPLCKPGTHYGSPIVRPSGFRVSCAPLEFRSREGWPGPERAAGADSGHPAADHIVAPRA